MTEEWDGKEIVVILIGVIGQTGGMYLGVTASCICSRSDGIPLRAATSIVATVHWTDRSFRVTSPPTKFPPLAVV